MKKLIVAAFAVAVTAAAQAATINWAISNVKEASETGSSVNVATGSYSAYLFVTANTTGVSLTTATKSVILESLAEAHMGGDWATLSGAIASASATHATNTGAGAWTGTVPGLGSEFASGSATAFAVIFNSADIASATAYYLLDTEKSVTFTSSTGMKLMSWGSQATNSAYGIDKNAAGWTSIAPEPTSGLMMLLGMGVLALRRRRA